jgi:hypothetical protein
LTDGNDTRTKEQLLAEIEALKKQLLKQDSGALSSESAGPVLSVPITRRQAIGTWIAPVILSVPVLGAVLAPSTAEAERCVPAPTAVPTAAPTTPAPTRAPSRAPSAAPTTVKKAMPTLAPVKAPTMSPTAPLGAMPIRRPGPAGVTALGSAIAISGAKVRNGDKGST